MDDGYWAKAPKFGEQLEHQQYIARPGSYVIVLDEKRGVAVVQTEVGYHLPGGGAEPGETEVQTLQREVREECGFNFFLNSPDKKGVQVEARSGLPERGIGSHT